MTVKTGSLTSERSGQFEHSIMSTEMQWQQVSPFGAPSATLQQTTLPLNVGSQQLSLANNMMALEEPSLEHGNIMSENMLLQQLPSASIAKTSSFLQSSTVLNLGSQQIPTKDKQISQGEPWLKVITPGTQQFAVSNKGTALSDKKPKVQNRTSGNVGSQKSSSVNKRSKQATTPLPKAAEPSPKVPSETVEIVRSKMRESLSAALELVMNEENKVQVTVDEEMESCKPKPETSPSHHASECHMETLKESDIQNFIEAHHESVIPLTTDNTTSECDSAHEYEQKDSSVGDDVSFSENILIKDELLQGNGLCWAILDDDESNEAKENHDAKRPRPSHDELDSVKPRSLALKIESQLFKLFGGVNKKYKEKGRSLLFNLKDQHNPELRKRVFYGEIDPERLCSMTPEELASKELSQWRIAKAEKMAQMVVLPDSEVDLRRLVKKTHKGEFQLEVERDETVSAEVTLGANSLAQLPTKNNESKVQSRLTSSQKESQISNKFDKTQSVAVSDGMDLGDQTHSCNLTTCQHDNSDLMQILMVDEHRDEASLPPIPSLDEFMMELDSEPPFMNLQASGAQEPSSSDEKPVHSLAIKLNAAADSSVTHASSNGAKLKLDTALDLSETKMDAAANISSSKASHASDNYKFNTERTSGTSLTKMHHTGGSDEKSNQMDAKPNRADGNVKPANIVPKGELVWDGLIQLNISSLVTALGFRKSGEKTSTKEWPSFLEIKGRVRLDAFEKFLQELRMCQSHAIMVLNFCWKEGSPESGRIKLCETIDSYIVDQRVGVAEPLPEIEIYFCPPHQRTTQMLIRNLSKEHEGAVLSARDCLIGIAVWKRAVVPPKSHSQLHPKHSSKTHQPESRTHHQDRHTNANSKMNPPVPPPSLPPPPSEEEVVDDDDVPPGFGPPVGRDDDDLPEFDFVRSNSQAPGPNATGGAHVGAPHVVPPLPRPVEQIRQMIQKYGQNSNQDDDDDDIPEWQPDQENQTHTSPPPSQQQLHGYHHLVMQPHIVNERLGPMPLHNTHPQQHFGPIPPHPPVPGQWQAGAGQPAGAMLPPAPGRHGSSGRPQFHGTPRAWYAHNGMAPRPGVHRYR